MAKLKEVQEVLYTYILTQDEVDEIAKALGQTDCEDNLYLPFFNKSTEELNKYK